MKESEFHQWLRDRLPPDKNVLLGVGDDAAVLDARGPVAAACDLVVEGVHFERGKASPERIGAKAVNRNFSDMAAMGIAPRWILASAALPEGTESGFVHALVEGMVQAAARFDAVLVGGDTSRSPGPLVLDVTVIGPLEELSPVPRGGARAGDRVLVTGTLGGASLGRHLTFTPRVKEGLFLNRGYHPHAMIDISDGLALDLSRILDASGTGAVIRGDGVPLSDAAKEMAARSGRSPLEHALSDGEDFELLFTLPPERAKALLEDPDRFFPVADLGEILPDPGERFILHGGGEKTPLGREGYDHIV